MRTDRNSGRAPGCAEARRNRRNRRRRAFARAGRESPPRRGFLLPR
ncbi:hypothetical protein GLE_2416 [Lysobacter enzymogenes]|uniref:Uncharacterized protein n=1 Tax=Lysobacter enzymogenes TaxID=69 RepID=A0A0S2DGQ9_LYSEN|nr:hypothetical protein GLE_2416 [Lysobacter enzymogenes]